jgi:hypothetical protein
MTNRLSDVERAKIIMVLMRIVNPETTVADLELVITDIERVLIEEGTIKVKK